MIRIFPALLATLILAAAACQPAQTGGTGPSTAGGQAFPTIRIGSTNFTEQEIVAELYALVLEQAGYKVERRYKLGSREIVAPALESGQIDMYPEYLATYVIYLTKDPAKGTPDAAQTYATLQEALRGRNITALQYAQAINSNGFVVTKAYADRHNLRNISDLAKLNNQMVLGGPPECPDRPLCLQGLQRVYGLSFREFKPLDVGGPLTVAALEGNQIDVAVLFTTDAVIAAKGFVLLNDDKKLQPADNLVPVVRNDFLTKTPNQDQFKKLVNDVTAKLTTEELTQLNRQVGVDRREPKDAAAAWLRSKGLLR
ncbi:MAG: ABC transporter substrate-binding protein [Chloroflexota bacterium]|nr:ABC transporter substrate-binding protein [Dehalococcoidia bacterium]MDW8253829.1 ABC transporter substrate-binding protein [Chloroflexota bacterium]